MLTITVTLILFDITALYIVSLIGSWFYPYKAHQYRYFSETKMKRKITLVKKTICW